jgi:hypothetical protein
MGFKKVSKYIKEKKILLKNSFLNNQKLKNALVCSLEIFKLFIALLSSQVPCKHLMNGFTFYRPPPTFEFEEHIKQHNKKETVTEDYFLVYPQV